MGWNMPIKNTSEKNLVLQQNLKKIDIFDGKLNNNKIPELLIHSLTLLSGEPNETEKEKIDTCFALFFFSLLFTTNKYIYKVLSALGPFLEDYPYTYSSKRNLKSFVINHPLEGNLLYCKFSKSYYLSLIIKSVEIFNNDDNNNNNNNSINESIKDYRITILVFHDLKEEKYYYTFCLSKHMKDFFVPK